MAAENNQIMSAKKLSDFPDIDRRITAHLQNKLNISHATKVQQKSFEALIRAKDALIRSETGSGKTLAYSVPMVHNLIQSKSSRSEGTIALIIAPTRELCIQIFEVLKKVLSIFPWLVPGTLMGGEKKKSEKARLRRGINVLVTTPGRCLDHLKNTERFKTENLRWLVLDEADRLLDLGFGEKIREILELVNKRCKKTFLRNRHNILVSATLTKMVRQMSNFALQNPVFIGETKDTEEFNAMDEGEIGLELFDIPDTILQKWVKVDEDKRLVTLIALLIDHRHGDSSRKVIIFLSTCSEVEFYTSFFQQLSNFFELIQGKRFNLFKLHGDMAQKDRTAVFFKFCESQNAVLFCTDIAARGLDLPSVDLIIQFDAPISPVEYIHRIGRTARLNSIGSAILFVMPSELAYVDILKNQKEKSARNGLREEKAAAILRRFEQKMQKSLNKKQKKLVGSSVNDFLMTKVFSVVSSDAMLREKAKTAFDSFVKSYVTYPKSLKHIFHPSHLRLESLSKSFGIHSKTVNWSRKRKTVGAENTQKSTKKVPFKPKYQKVENDKFTRNQTNLNRKYNYAEIASKKISAMSEFDN